MKWDNLLRTYNRSGRAGRWFDSRQGHWVGYAATPVQRLWRMHLSPGLAGEARSSTSRAKPTGNWMEKTRWVKKKINNIMLPIINIIVIMIYCYFAFSGAAVEATWGKRWSAWVKAVQQFQTHLVDRQFQIHVLWNSSLEKRCNGFNKITCSVESQQRGDLKIPFGDHP